MPPSYLNNLGFDKSGTKLCILLTLPNIVMLFNCLAFPKGHNLYLFIRCTGCQCFCVQHEFSQGRCQRSGPFRAAEWAEWCHRSLQSRSSVIFSACHCLLDLPGPDQCLCRFIQQDAELLVRGTDGKMSRCTTITQSRLQMERKWRTALCILPMKPVLNSAIFLNFIKTGINNLTSPPAALGVIWQWRRRIREKWLI